jgi:hypothetical protein
MRDEDNEIHAEVERERLKSRYRDRTSGRRVHPTHHDVARLIDFATDRRKRHGRVVREAARRLLPPYDGVVPTSTDRTEALRFLVSVVLDGGSCGCVMQRRCARVIGYCDVIETALSLRGRMK